MPCGTDKKEAIENLSNADFLLDDYTENLLSWVPPGKAIKLINDINHTHGTWKEDCIRFDRSPDNISGLISDVIMGNTHAFDTKQGFDSNHPFKDTISASDTHAHELLSIGLPDGDMVYFELKPDTSIEDVLSLLKSDDNPFVLASSKFTEVNIGDFAWFEQSENCTFSITYHYDDDSVDIYEINGGLGGIDEKNRTDENTKITFDVSLFNGHKAHTR